MEAAGANTFDWNRFAVTIEHANEFWSQKLSGWWIVSQLIELVHTKTPYLCQNNIIVIVKLCIGMIMIFFPNLYKYLHSLFP